MVVAERKYRQTEGRISVIRKPGVKPSSPQSAATGPIKKFILAAVRKEGPLSGGIPDAGPHARIIIPGKPRPANLFPVPGRIRGLA